MCTCRLLLSNCFWAWWAVHSYKKKSALNCSAQGACSVLAALPQTLELPNAAHRTLCSCFPSRPIALSCHVHHLCGIAAISGGHILVKRHSPGETH